MQARSDSLRLSAALAERVPKVSIVPVCRACRALAVSWKRRATTLFTAGCCFHQRGLLSRRMALSGT